MRITDFLHYLDTDYIDIWVADGNLMINTNDSQYGKLPESADVQKAIKYRLLNNQFAQERGWLVGNFGEVYTYQYGTDSFIFIERNDDETVDYYRRTFKNGKVHQTTGVISNITFSDAYLQAKNSLDWFYRRYPPNKRRIY